MALSTGPKFFRAPVTILNRTQVLLGIRTGPKNNFVLFRLETGPGSCFRVWGGVLSSVGLSPSWSVVLHVAHVSNFQGIAHTGECEGSSSVPVAPPKREARIYEAVPAGSLPKYHLISFRCSLVLLFVPVSAVHDFRRSSHPHAHARHLGFAHARA